MMTSAFAASLCLSGVSETDCSHSDGLQDDLWDFGTIRTMKSVRSTRGTVRHQPTHPTATALPRAPQTAQPAPDHATGVTSRDYAAGPPIPPKSNAREPSMDSFEGTVRRAAPPVHSRESSDESTAAKGANGHSKQSSGEDEDEEEQHLLDTVVLPVLDSVRIQNVMFVTELRLPGYAQIANRITNNKARTSLYKFRRAIEEAEKDIPGLINVFVAGKLRLVYASTVLTVSQTSSIASSGSTAAPNEAADRFFQHFI